MNILQYRKFIDTECSNQTNTILKTKALKIDGKNSLKMEFNCKDLKSSDYLKYKKNEIIFIEISDLQKQFNDIKIKNDLLSKDCKKQLGKNLTNKIEPRNIIREELREKFIQTDLILHKLLKFIKFNIDKSKIFIIAICSNSISDVMAFQYLINDLKSSLKSFLKDIKIVLAKDLGMVV